MHHVINKNPALSSRYHSGANQTQKLTYQRMSMYNNELFQSVHLCLDIFFFYGGIMQIVNENKLYQIIDRFFTLKQNLLGELIQNAVRANATKVRVTTSEDNSLCPEKNYTLTIKDNGNGITDLKALLGIAYSDWDEKVYDQEPAGMGFLQLIANAKTVRIKSLCGNVKIVCDKFLNDSEYRMNLITKNKMPDKTYPGTEIIAEMKEPSHEYKSPSVSDYSGFRTSLIINNRPIKQRTINLEKHLATQQCQLYRIYQFKGNDLFLSIDKQYSYIQNSKFINWFGQFINPDIKCLLGSSIKLYYDVHNGTPLTPKYPDRTSLIEDAKYYEFSKFVKEKISEFLLEYFLSKPWNELTKEYHNINLLKTFYQVASDEDKDKMPYLPVNMNALDISDTVLDVIMNKSDLVERSYQFTKFALRVNNKYRLAADLPVTIVIIADAYRDMARSMGLKEITRLSCEAEPLRERINLKPLELTLEYDDDVPFTCSIDKALMCDDYNNFFVYAENHKEIYDTFMESYQDIIGSDESYDSVDTQIDLARNDFIDEYEARFNIISFDRFNFLSNARMLNSLVFQENKLVANYNDYSSREYILEDL